MGKPAAGSGPPGEVSYAQLGTQSARMEVVAPAPAVVLVRVPFDPNWHASVDGKPGRILNGAEKLGPARLGRAGSGGREQAKRDNV